MFVLHVNNVMEKIRNNHYYFEIFNHLRQKNCRSSLWTFAKSPTFPITEVWFFGARSHSTWSRTLFSNREHDSEVRISHRLKLKCCRNYHKLKFETLKLFFWITESIQLLATFSQDNYSSKKPNENEQNYYISLKERKSCNFTVF